MRDRHWGWPSRARVLAQSFEEPLTDGGVPPGLLKPMLSLGLMRSLEALADHAEDPRPVLAFHVGTLAHFGCQLGRRPLGTTIESGALPGWLRHPLRRT